jgi:hypothetical protein
MKHLYNVLLMVLCACQVATAQDMQKCCGSSNNTFLLGNTNYARHTQCLYLPSDLTNATAGMIGRIYYRYGSTGQGTGNTLTDLRISLKQVAGTGFNNFHFFTGLTTVLESESYTIPPGTTGEWFGIDLDQPFQYDPTLTLVVDIVFDSSTTVVFGTLSSPMSGRKIYSADPTSPTGGALVTNWQDIGFDLDLSTGVAMHNMTSGRLFPVPVNDRLRLHFTETREHRGESAIIDLGGRTILEAQIPVAAEWIELNTSDLPAGAYILRSVFADGSSESHKFIRD